MDVIVTILHLVGALGVFLYGMRVMSDGIQKLAGDRMQAIMNFMTRNRVVAVLTGFMITALVQSSSATTVMVVSFVNAMLLNLQQAIGVIMGANIGTTVTTWIVSYFGFKFKISAIAIPIIGVGFPFVLSRKHSYKNFGMVLVGFGLLFLGLTFLKDSVPDIKNHPEILEFLKNYSSMGFWSYLIFVAVGTVLTIIVQSSSAAMAVTVTMAFKGWIDFPTAAAIVLGENIGTTITAYLASIGTNVHARRAARAHFLFNVFGVIWLTFIFNAFLRFILWLAPWDATLQENLPLNLSLFHTIFNISNTLVFLPFITPFAQLVNKLVKERKDEISRVYKLAYISSGIQDTVQMNLFKVQSEIKKMARIGADMVASAIEVFHNPDKHMGETVDEIKQREDYTDQMQEQISMFLVHCLEEGVGEKTTNNINAMLRITHELENIADSAFRLILLIEKKRHKKIELHPAADEEITAFSSIVMKFIIFVQERMIRHLSEDELYLALELEKKVDQSRHKLKKGAQKRIQEGADVRAELLYIDLLRHLEHIGDHSLNIAEALRSYQ